VDDQQEWMAAVLLLDEGGAGDDLVRFHKLK